MAAYTKILKSSMNIKEIDANVKNKFKWEWLEETDTHGDKLATYITKLDKPGIAMCEICHQTLSYGSKGKQDLKSHSKGKKHSTRRDVLQSNTKLPVLFTECEKSDLVDDDWEPCEDEWKPPTEAEMKVLQAKRERSDKISKLMGDYLLKGYRMLGSTCGKCETILLQTKHGENYCVACSELDSDTDKDDPALNNEAARRQAAEQHEREDSGSPSEPVANVSAFVSANVPENRNKQPRVPYQFPLIHRPCPESLHVSNYDSEEQQFHSVSDLPPTGTGLGGANGIRSSLEIVQEKLSWATCELKNSKSVDYSIQLCQLIKSCADTIASLKCLTVEKVGSI